MKLVDYEMQVVDEIARHRVEPNAVAKLLAYAGKPIDKLLDVSRTSKVKAIRTIGNTIESSIEKALVQTIKVANNLVRDKAILSKFEERGCSLHAYGVDSPEIGLEIKDQVADCFDLSNAIILAAEGLVMGVAATLAEGVPGAQFLIPTVVASDVAASMTLLSRHSIQIAASYGFSPSEDSSNIAHVLAAMAPHTSSSDEGYLSTKAVAMDAIRDAGKFLAKPGGRQINRAVIDKEAPALVKLINYVAERLGIVITEKELGMLVPVAGGVLNGGVNVAFQQVGHTTAKDYFRVLTLGRKYGEEYIESLIRDRMKRFSRG